MLFLHLLAMIMWFVSFILLMCYMASIQYKVLHFWDKSHLVMAYNYFYMLLCFIC